MARERVQSCLEAGSQSFIVLSAEPEASERPSLLKATPHTRWYGP